MARFVPGQRDFRPNSYAVGGLLNLSPQWQLTGNIAHTERAPKDYELYADGPHLATNGYEVGDSALNKERALQFDVGAAWKSGFNTFVVNAYRSTFNNYIGLVQSVGVTRNQADGEVNPVEDPVNPGTSLASGAPLNALPEFRYLQTRAQFTGLEASGNIRLIEGASALDLALRADVVKATNLGNGQPLSRIPPMRLGATLRYASGPFGASFGFDYSATQTRLPATDVAAAASTRWNAGVNYRMKAGPVNLLWFTRLDNMTNQLAFSPTSVLTTTAFARAPLPGRSLKMGLQASF